MGSKMVRAKKALGQHFLKDMGIARKIADTITREGLPQSVADKWGNLPIVEIGPGMGILSQFLMQTGRQVKAVELDAESVEFLKNTFPTLDVTEADFLKLNLRDFVSGDFALIGNYPYNISSQIFFKVLDYREQIPVVAGMLQKEVAQRICSKPGSKVYGILSVLLQAWYDCEYLFDVGPLVFAPPPKVTSGVIRLIRNNRDSLGCDDKRFKTVVKTAFGQRRKTLRNSLAPLLGANNPLLSDPILGERPERLSVEDFVRITNALPSSVNIDECKEN